MNMDCPMRVLVVDDTITYRKLVSEALAGERGIEVVGAAANGKIALQRIPQLRPDLLTLDLEMPEMSGLEVLQWLKKSGSDVGAIVLSGTTNQGANSTVAALGLGAFDFVLKPTGGSFEENIVRLRKDLSQRILAYGQHKTVCRILHGPPSPSAPPVKIPQPPVPHRAAQGKPAAGRPEVVVLGISTGGPQSLTKVLPQLPANFKLPLLIVQHMPPVFTKSLADDLNRRCKVKVCEAADGQPVEGGVIMIAPGGKQMKVKNVDGSIVASLTDDPPENSCRPSVDYLFRSVSEVYGGNSIGVIMTGMGSDGTRGCRELKRLGASIIVQDQATSVVFGMPKGPIDEGIADIVAPLQDIALEIVRLAGSGGRPCK
jgi:two-component system, chemotaxis family, protein-glutamate methylesterase/glutaminase